MRSDGKLGHVTRSELVAQNGKNASVRGHLADVRAKMAREQMLFDACMHEADKRRAWLRAMGDFDPLSVYVDFHALSAKRELDICDLPAWRDLGETMKCLLLNRIAIDLSGYAFTVNVREELVAKWMSEGRDPLDRISRIMTRSLQARGLGDLEYLYVVEGKDKSGRRRKPLHIHGVFISKDDYTATRFKQAMEDGLAGLMKSGKARKRAIHIKRAFDASPSHMSGRCRWIGYILKNVMRKQVGMAGRRLYISREATKTIQQFWYLIKNVPLGAPASQLR